MSLIFGYPNNKGVKVSEYLTSLGVNLLRCALSSFECFVTVSVNQPAYKTYIHFLPAYMAALCLQTKVSVIEPFHPLQYSSDEPLVTGRLPDVSVSFPNNPATELLEHIRSEGGKDMTVKGQKILLLYQPTPGLIRRIVEAGAIRTTAAASESVNIASLGSLMLIRRIFSCFFSTHQYPAFADVDHMDYSEAHWIVEKETGRKRVAPDSGTGHAKKRTRGKTAATSVDADEDEDMEEQDSSIPPGHKIIYAIPPAKSVIGWGDDSAVPANDGLFVRYIDETQNGQGEKIIQEVIGRYFLGCLGNNADAVKAAMEKLKSDLGIIVNTWVGRELAHMAKCIDIGLQAQARIFPVVSSGQYLGSVLLGAGFQIHAYGSTYTSVLSVALQKQIEQAGSHKSSLKAVADLLCQPGSNSHAMVTSVTTGLELKSLLDKANCNNETRDKVRQLARGFRFKPKAWNVSANNMVSALSLIQDPALALEDSFPIHPSAYFETDRLAIVWGAFGDLAPTPVFPGGPIVNLASTKDRPKHIGLRLVPLKDALVDLQMVLSTKKYSGSSLNRRSGPFKDRVYTGVDGTRIISAFSSAAGITRDDKGKGKERSSAVAGGSLFDDGF